MSSPYDKHDISILKFPKKAFSPHFWRHSVAFVVLHARVQTSSLLEEYKAMKSCHSLKYLMFTCKGALTKSCQTEIGLLSRAGEPEEEMTVVTKKL